MRKSVSAFAIYNKTLLLWSAKATTLFRLLFCGTCIVLLSSLLRINVFRCSFCKYISQTSFWGCALISDKGSIHISSKYQLLTVYCSHFCSRTDCDLLGNKLMCGFLIPDFRYFHYVNNLGIPWPETWDISNQISKFQQELFSTSL